MNRYLLDIQNGNANCNAGFKAPADVVSILRNNGWTVESVRTDLPLFRSVFYFLGKMFSFFFKVERHSDILVQYPVYSEKGNGFFQIIRLLLKLKNIRFIGLVHDVRYMRGLGNPVKQEIKELNLFDTVIVHSFRMKDALQKQGCISELKLLGLFDYPVEKTNKEIRQSGFDVCYVGNLSNRSFISNLGKLTEDSSLEIELYGFPELCPSSERVHYRGGFQPSDVSSIKGSWGLVWDGDSLESPQGVNAEYQKFNSPHKASLYVVAEMPLIVHSSAAIASVVK